MLRSDAILVATAKVIGCKGASHPLVGLEKMLVTRPAQSNNFSFKWVVGEYFSSLF